MGRCKHLGSLNSFLSYASQLSGGIVLPVRVLWAQKWTFGGPESQLAVTSFLDMAGDTPFHKGKSLLEQHLVVSDFLSFASCIACKCIHIVIWFRRQKKLFSWRWIFYILVKWMVKPSFTDIQRCFCVLKLTAKIFFMGNWLIFLLIDCVCAKSLQSCLTLCDPMDCNPPDSSVHGILQARILEWVAISSSRGSSQCREQTCVSWHWQVGSLPLVPPGKPFTIYHLPFAVKSLSLLSAVHSYVTALGW